MDLISRKYTVLMGNEPLTLWIKNNEVQSAKFMDKKVSLYLNEDAVRLIKDNPTKVINGNNLLKNEQFTQAVSKMMSAKLDLAIVKNDHKTLSRFARSELVPENMRHDFIAAINRQNGLRGALKRAIISTNAIFQNLAKKIDRYFDKVSDKIANKKLDPYLSKYQLNYINRAPPVSNEQMDTPVNAKLMQLTKDFFKSQGIDKREFKPWNLEDKILLNTLMEQAVQKGFTPLETKIAAFQLGNTQKTAINLEAYRSEMLRGHEELLRAKEHLLTYQKIEAGKNETLKDFETLAIDLKTADRIDILSANKEYLALPREEQLKYEDLHIFKYESVYDRAAAVAVAMRELNNPTVETVIDRTPVLDFNDKSVQAKINTEWTNQQNKNRSAAEPTRDFMNISAVKFNGVSREALDKWAEVAKGYSKVDAVTIDKFVDASMRNAKELEKIGVLQEVSKDNYKFVDNYAKQALYNNINKTVSQIREANQGVQKEISIDRDEIKERVAHMASEQTFKEMLTPTGELDSQKLYDFAQKLQNAAAALHKQESPNITKEDIQKAEMGYQRQQQQELKQSQGAENAR